MFGFFVPFFTLMLFSVTLSALSLEEKVGQLFVVHFKGDTAEGDAKRLIEEAHVGGFIVYNWVNDLSSPEKVKELTSSLQSLSPISLFLSIDQEGGPVRRLQGDSYPYIPSNRESGTAQLAAEQASTIAEMLAYLGFNMNFAPVVDISEKAGINPERCYGKDPLQVVTCANEALKAYHRKKIICTLKHFPGHGSVTSDSHETLPVQSKSLKDLQESDLIPFQALAGQTDCIMTSHVIVKAIDPFHPVTFSPLALDYLRKTLHFDGLIIADSLTMGASELSYSSFGESCKAAILAGCDLLIFGEQNLNKAGRREITVDEFIDIHAFIVQSVQSGEIPEERIDQSVARILKVKKDYGLIN